MDTAMRDLDQLRERGDETTGRKLGLFVMAAILSVAAVFAMGIMIGRGGNEDAGPALDPLAQLALAPEAEKAQAEPSPAAEIKPEALSFPATLVDKEDPLVEATVRAAEAEHAALTGTPIPAPEPLPALPSVAPAAVADLPASSVATQESARLERVAKHDPLVAQALPKETPTEVAPAGSEGAYTLQVVSYESSDQADRFAKALRARGHKAFVAQADVPNRGRFYRVRVGPFTTKQDAVSYQSKFESDERMHTILVSNTGK